MMRLDGIGKPIIVATYPRSGTHLTIDLLRKQFEACKSWKLMWENYHNLYLDLDPLLISNYPADVVHKKALHFLSRSYRPIIKTHGSLPWLEKYSDWLAEIVAASDIFYVVRDGRNSLCSQQVFMHYYAPESFCSISEFIRHTQNGSSRPKIWANHILNWIDRPHIHLLKFEEILKNPYQTVTDMGKILGLPPLYIEPLLPRKTRHLQESLWLQYTQCQPESTNHIAATPPAQWFRDWNEADRQFFHQEAGDILIRLGYESSDGWVRSAKI